MYASGSTDSNDGSSTPSTASNTLPSESTLSNNIGNTADLATEILAVHNNERKAVGVPELMWSDELAAGAQAWAEHLGTSGTFDHSSPPTSLMMWVRALQALIHPWGYPPQGNDSLYGSTKRRIITANQFLLPPRNSKAPRPIHLITRRWSGRTRQK